MITSNIDVGNSIAEIWGLGSIATLLWEIVELLREAFGNSQQDRKNREETRQISAAAPAEMDDRTRNVLLVVLRGGVILVRVAFWPIMLPYRQRLRNKRRQEDKQAQE